jgi:hypothetical protein
VRFFKCLDAIEYYSEEKRRLTEEISTQLSQGKHSNTGTGFILCRSVADLHIILTTFKGNSIYPETLSWKLSRAPAPSEVKWENYNLEGGLHMFKRVLIYVVFFIIFFLLLTPAGIFSFLSLILSDIGAGALLVGLFGRMLPSLILFLYQSVILRNSVKFIVELEKLKNKSSEIINSLVKIAIVMVFYILFVPLLGMQAYNLIENVLEGDVDEWRRKLAGGICYSGQLFALFIIHIFFLKNGADLLQIPKLFRVKFRQARALNETERLLAYEAYEFRWAYEYGVSMTAITIILVFSIAYPLIIFFGFLFFTFRVTSIQYFVAKYNMLCFYHPVPHTTGQKIAESVSIGILFAVFLFQVIHN